MRGMKDIFSKFLRAGERTAPIFLVATTVLLMCVGGEESTKEEVLFRVSAINGLLFGWVVLSIIQCLGERGE